MVTEACKIQDPEMLKIAEQNLFIYGDITEGLKFHDDE